MGGKVGEKPAALRAAEFSLASKNLRGRSNAPPPAGRGLTRALLGLWIFHRLLGGGAFERPPHDLGSWSP